MNAQAKMRLSERGRIYQARGTLSGNILVKINSEVAQLEEENKELKGENEELNKLFVHIKTWIQQPDGGMTKQQLAAAVVRMCDDAFLKEQCYETQ